MKDIRLIQDECGEFDIEISNGGFAFENSWRSHIIVSLFEDQRLPEVIAKTKPYNMRGGSPAEILLNFNGLKRGSLLWTKINKAVVDSKLIQEVQKTCEKALQWITDGKLVKECSVVVSAKTAKSIEIKVNIVNLDNTSENNLFGVNL